MTIQESTVYSAAGAVPSMPHLKCCLHCYVLPETLKSIKNNIQAPKIARFMRTGFPKLGDSEPETHSEASRTI